MTQWGSGWPADFGAFQPFGTPPAAPEPPPPPPSRWPSTALWVGVSAVALAFFPAGIGFVAVPVGIFGVVAGVLGVQAAQREKRSPGAALTGIVVSVVAMSLAAVMFFAFYRSSPEEPAKPTTLSTSTRSGPAQVIPRYNRSTDVVLTREVDVTFGQYGDSGEYGGSRTRASTSPWSASAISPGNAVSRCVRSTARELR